MNFVLNFRSYILIVALFLTYSCRQESDLPIKTGYGITAENGMVVSAHPEASIIGAEILKMGGNAIDAAAATGFALAVCYPNAGNIGGGGLLVLRNADGSVNSLDYREKAPGQAGRDMYLNEEGDVVKGLSTSTHLASGVPGSVAGLCEAHAKYGLLDFSEVIQPAIDLANNGFPITEKQASGLNAMKKIFQKRNNSLTAFQKDTPWTLGDLLIQEELAATLERIRDNGADGFYKGETADYIVSEMNKAGGLITYEDLENYSAIWRDPVITDYKNYKIISMPPPSSGGLALKQLFGMIEDYPLSDWGFLSREAVHLMTEAERRVYADRAEYLGDPDFFDVPMEELSDNSYIKDRMQNFDLASSSDSKDISAGKFVPYESEETTHYSIADSFGNSVSVTTTLNGGYGNFVVVKGAGFLLNNEMDDFSVKPGYPNIYGLIGGEANSIEPDKRMLSSMTPSIVEKDNELYMVVGSPGGSTIITSVFQVIVNVLEFDMDMQAAVDAGRFHHQWMPDYIDYEREKLDSGLVKSLEDMGHTLKARSSIGRVDAIRILEGRLFEAGADKRGDDIAAAY
ncbi:MAG: gamma-glutamyltransferase [Bacteroidales bacterium]|nr:gamma-glutamyltransferase [Bacteroidales bacterium]